MFNQKNEVAPIKVGDLVVVGCTKEQNGQSKFIPTNTRGEKITVERIYEEMPGLTRIDLNWGSLGRSKVYAKDEGKSWHRVSNFN